MFFILLHVMKPQLLDIFFISNANKKEEAVNNNYQIYRTLHVNLHHYCLLGQLTNLSGEKLFEQSYNLYSEYFFLC